VTESGSKNYKITGVIAVSVAAAMWGLDGVVLTPRLYNLDVRWVVFVLHLIPFILMNIFFYKEYKHLLSLTKADWLTFFLISLFGGAIGTIAIVKALFLVNFHNLSVIVLLQKLQPVFAISLASILLKEKLQKYFILWASLAIVASYFLTFGLSFPDFHQDRNTIYAVLLSLLAAFSFGSSTVFSKKILTKYTFPTATFFRYGITTAIMLFVVLVSGTYDQFSKTTSENWLFFLIISFTTGSGAIYLYYYGLVRIRAIMATIAELFFPVSAIFFDYFVNGKILSTVQWIAAVIMIFAIVKLTGKAAKQ
jgi:drug/metabolite transporter (DMT)-like permease